MIKSKIKYEKSKKEAYTDAKKNKTTNQSRKLESWSFAPSTTAPLVDRNLGWGGPPTIPYLRCCPNPQGNNGSHQLDTSGRTEIWQPVRHTTTCDVKEIYSKSGESDTYNTIWQCHIGLNVLPGTAPTGPIKLPYIVAPIIHIRFLKNMYGYAECTFILVVQYISRLFILSRAQR